MGGSACDDGATEVQLQFFKKNPGCFPVVAGAVVHLPVGGGNWRAYYVSPYKAKPSEMVAIWPYSTPQMGGHFHWAWKHSKRFPNFFCRMSKNRSTMARILLSVEQNSRQKISISPRATANQERYNLAAQNESLTCIMQSIHQTKSKADNSEVESEHSSTSTESPRSSPSHIYPRLPPIAQPEDHQHSILRVMNQQVVYSFVAYTVGNHQDVTKTNVSKELIECKAFLHWTSKSGMADDFYFSLGRGGLGPGQFSVMIVDHPDG